MAASSTPKVPRDGSLTLAGGTLAAFTVPYEQGDVSISEVGTEERIVIYQRDVVVAVRKGKQSIPTITLTVAAAAFTDASSGEIWDVLKFTGSRSTDTSTATIKGDFPMLTATFTKAAVGADTAAHTVTATGCIGTLGYAEGRPDMYSITLEVYGAITRTGQA